MHGSTMMFLFAVPVMEAFAIYLVPLMLGTRNVAFPRLNAFSYWVYLFGGVMLWMAFALNEGPDVGWFAYVPLSGPLYGIGKRPDIWAQMITYTELSGLAVAVEIVVTVFKMRAPGMTLDRIPLFVWASLVTAFMILIAMPAGLQIFCWLATLWAGRPQFKTPLLFVLGFIVVFVIGGLSGVMVASVPIDTQVHDTYFVVAHFHYVLIGGSVFPLIAAIYYWFPKATGRMLDE